MQHIEKPGDSNKNTDRPRSVYIATYGCQMNQRDSEVICGILNKEGYKLTADSDKADIIIFNTCSVRQHAEDKVWSEIGRYKAKGPLLSLRTNHASKKIIGVIGCMAQAYKEAIFERAPNVNFVVGPADIHRIPEIVSSLVKKRGQSPKNGDSPRFSYERKIWETEGEARPEEIYHTGFYTDKNHAFVVISEGCSNFCSYCVVPYVRGHLKNRNPKDILREIKEAIDKGIDKITLLGQNVNAYVSNAKCKMQNAKLQLKIKNCKEVNFIELLRMVNVIKGLKEFSFVTSHPKDTTVELFKVMAECNKLKKYLHLPVQSGSDRILKLMNRNYTRKFYLDLADNYRKIVKGGVLTTDIIVGFPSETKVDFQDTYDLVKKVGFNAGFIFKYSPRPYTEASKLPDDVAKEEKERRHQLILELQKKISQEKRC